MRFVILGGGCYGSFYARQLLRARDAGAVEVDEIVVVDHDPEPRARRELGARPGLRYDRADWRAFLARYLPALSADAPDQLVTPPFTPHLALAWLLDRLRERRPGREWTLEPFRRLPGTPFERQAEGGPLVVSHADWECPVHCIEPATCPATRGPRYWDLDRTVRQLAVALDEGGQPVDGIHLFHCHHVAYGVGAYRAAAVTTAFDQIAGHVEGTARARAARFLIGTISHCHGALHLLVGRPGTLPEAAAHPVSAAPNPHPMR
ncbi:MAG TPA: hypothetical protein VF212_13445 [Longimicrobiales bacterium]